jgi:hypothetical protein
VKRGNNLGVRYSAISTGIIAHKRRADMRFSYARLSHESLGALKPPPRLLSAALALEVRKDGRQFCLAIGILDLRHTQFQIVQG